MPLEKGTSKKILQKNITAEMNVFKKTGKMGNSHPKSKKKAVKQAAAIAYSKAGKSKKQVNEHFILGFIKSLVDKNYSQADKYLQGQVDSLVSKKIETAVKATKTK